MVVMVIVMVGKLLEEGSWAVFVAAEVAVADACWPY